MARTGPPRLAVLGAGPIGLEAALYAAHLKLPCTVYERGRVGEHLRQWGHVRLFSPFGMNATRLGLDTLRSEAPQHTLPAEGDCVTGREHLAAYLEPLAGSRLLREHLQTETAVLSIGRRGYLKGDSPGDGKRGQQPFLLLLRDNKKRERVEEADVVLDCTGTYAHHRYLGEGGIPAVGEVAARPHIAYGLEDVLGDRRAAYADKNVLVLGAGYSAATTVCNLAKLAEQHPSTWVIWLARGGGSQPIKRVVNDPLRERDQLAVRANLLATRGDGNVEFHTQAVIEAVECEAPDKGFKVRGRRAGKPVTWEVERVIANVGYTPNTDLYRELQVHECYATLGPMALAAALSKHAGGDCLTLPAQGAATLRNPEPNFFVLGAKSYGRNSHFLLRTGFEQVREVFTLLTGKADLNLYRKK
jgi:thioredoxin reductase